MNLTFNQFEYLLLGTVWTVALSLVGVIGGGIFGLGIALLRVSRHAIPQAVASLYVGVIQGIPLPVLMFLAYFGLSVAGVDVPAFVAASVAMTISASAYLGDIWRGCIQAVARTQWEAADSLGLSRLQQLTDVILPQAIRIALPPTAGFAVQIIKNTSYAVVIGFIELTQAGKIVNNVVFEPFLIFTIVGAIYFILCWPLSNASRRLEARLQSRGA